MRGLTLIWEIGRKLGGNGLEDFAPSCLEDTHFHFILLHASPLHPSSQEASASPWRHHDKHMYTEYPLGMSRSFQKVSHTDS